jgi:hypothetical protein
MLAMPDQVKRIFGSFLLDLHCVLLQQLENHPQKASLIGSENLIRNSTTNMFVGTAGLFFQ